MSIDQYLHNSSLIIACLSIRNMSYMNNEHTHTRPLPSSTRHSEVYIMPCVCLSVEHLYYRYVIIIDMLLSHFHCVYSLFLYFVCVILSLKHLTIKGFLFYLLYNYILLYPYFMCINYISIDACIKCTRTHTPTDVSVRSSTKRSQSTV